MSIKEAIERKPLNRGRSFTIVGQRDRRGLEAENILRRDGEILLAESSAIEMVKELVEVIGGDAKVSEPIYREDMTTEVTVSWNRTKVDGGQSYTGIIIEARPVLDELGIRSDKGIETLDEFAWRRKEIVEDAIVNAYRYPKVFFEGFEHEG